MKLSKIIFLVCSLAFTTLATSCGNDTVEPKPDDENKNDPYIPSLITPTGAPTLPAYKVMLSDKVNVTSPTDNTAIPGYLSSGNADFIIFDSTNAQKILNKAGENAKFIRI